MKGLAPNTEQVFTLVSTLECIKPFVLVGGTALSLQIATRLSENLDFMCWRKNKKEKLEIDIAGIRRELQATGKLESFDILDINHVEAILGGVKLSFYANPNLSPVKELIPLINNMKSADKTSIGAMKMEVLMRRSKFRDYYDIYSLLEAGEDIYEMMDIALKYSGHRLKSKNLLSMLTNSERFLPEDNFRQLQPVYEISPKQIEQRIRKALETPR